MESYQITAENLYNWDEKGFVIGIASATKRIMGREAYETGRIKGARQDGSREFISLLACICADGTALPPSLIYAGKDMMSTWIEDFSTEERAYFGVSENGWSCDALGLFWLEHVFHKETKKKAGKKRRLLIVDGHSSHVNMQFLALADKLRILILILPPHSTHRLQPLDVGLFSPLAKFYTNGLIKHMSDSFGMTNITKRDFWTVFKKAWDEAFTDKNIHSAFEKTGIFPLNPARVVKIIAKPEVFEVAIDPQILRTPTTALEVRRLQKRWIKSPTKEKADKAFRGLNLLVAQASIAQHRASGLEQALRNERKKRQRGKRLNLVGEEASGAQFFSPGRVQKARDLLAVKEEEERQRQEEISNAKVLAAAKKQKKEEEKMQRAVAMAEKRRLNVEAKAQKALERQAQLELKAEARKQKEASKQSQGRSTLPKGPSKRTIAQVIDATAAPTAKKVKEVIPSFTRTRRVQRPHRFTTP